MTENHINLGENSTDLKQGTTMTLEELECSISDDADKIPERKNKALSCLRSNLLTILTISGVFGGIALGFILRSAKHDKWSSREVMYINFLGDIFLRMLKSLIVPLIMSSLIAAIGSLDLSLSRKIGFRAIGYYMTTTICAVILGIILVMSIAPGKGNESDFEPSSPSNSRNVTTVDTLLDLLRNMFPPNIVQAVIQTSRTTLTVPENYTDDLYKWDIGTEYAEGTNILGLVVFAVAFAIALAKMGPKSLPLISFFQSLSETMMQITSWVIWVSPIGILFLVCSKIIEIDNFEVIIGQLGMYFLTVTIGVFFHGFVVLPLLFFVLTRQNPFPFIFNMRQTLITAFGTSSSSATLPVAIVNLEEKNKIDARVTRFVMPIGATINMDGTALYEAVAAIFIAQVRGIDLDLGHIIAISLTATAASIGAAGIPQAGLVTMVMVLDTVGLPAEDVSLIIAVDWLLDRFRTVVNVLGDSLGAGIVNYLSRTELTNMD